ncbi:MAG: HlyD family type I secretion periplasmic adaptor subunit [Rhodospirillales bacterium]
MKNPFPGLLKRTKRIGRGNPANARTEKGVTPPTLSMGAAESVDPAIMRRRRDGRPLAGPAAEPRSNGPAREPPRQVGARLTPRWPAKGLWSRLGGRLGSLSANESGAAPNWLSSLMRRAGFGRDEPADTNVYRDANRDWSERRRSGAPVAGAQARSYTWQRQREAPAPQRQQAERRQAPGRAGGPAQDRRAAFAGGAAAAAPGRASRPGGGEWDLPGVAAADRPGPASAFGGSLPKPLAALTDRLTRIAESNEGLSQRFIDALERISHSASGAGRPSGSGGRARVAAMDGGRGDGDRSFFGTGGDLGEWTDAELIQDAKEASKRETSHLARTLLRFVLLFIVVFVVWAALFNIDEVTRGEGRVIASSQTQVLGNLEGGVVREVLVREGDRVAKDDVIMRLDNAQAVANYRENRVRYLTLTAQVARLSAEVRGTPLSFPAEVMNDVPEVARAESALMSARISQFEAQMQILRNQRTQRAQDLADLRNKADKSNQQLKLVREQLRILEPLAAEGLAPRVEVIRNQRDLAQTQGELESAQLQIPKAEAAMREAERRIDERLDGFKSEARKELNEKALQLEQARETEVANRDRVTRTELRAPLSGVVKQIYVKTIGGTVKPGQDLVEVVPTEDTLLIEIKVKPADVGFVRAGQKANVKVSAYDYSLFGSLDAKVEDISADSFVDERPGAASEPYFRVRLRTAKSFLGPADRPLPISPGMVVNADILTGERTVLTYLTKPFFKTIASALGER